MYSSSNATSFSLNSILPEQLSLLEVVLPGFTRVSTAILQLLTGDLSIYAWLLWFIVMGKYASSYLWGWLDSHFTSKVYVLNNDEAYDMLTSWVSSQAFSQSTRPSLARVDLKFPWAMSGPKLHIDDSNKKQLDFSPWNGRFYFWYKQHLLALQRMYKHGELGIAREEVFVSCFGRNPSILREFLEECRRHYLALVQNKTCVFEHQGGVWKKAKTRTKRHLSTVILNEKVKEMLVNDISDFLDSTTKTWYSKRDIPYQRGYLFYGPPGTRKSSFGFSIAGQFDLDVYILDLSGLNDNNLKNLFAELPQHCIVLLEDVDAASSTRTDGTSTNLSQNSPHPFHQQSSNSTVSLSTLLNVLDGVGSPEGRVLIMTTNYIERLDSALIRPGRADMKVEFQLADEELVIRLFRFIYDSKLGESIEGDGIEKGKMIEDDKTSKLAEEFATKVPKLEFSPAEIMSHLLANKQSPRQAIENVGAWIENTREERKKMKRADPLIPKEVA